MPFKTKEAYRVYQRAYQKKYALLRYHTEPEFRLAKLRSVRASFNRWKVRVEAVLAAARAGGCQRCPEKDPCCLDFHHRDPSQKRFNIGSWIVKNKSRRDLSELHAELKKCDVLCSNCHKKWHAGRFEEKREAV